MTASGTDDDGDPVSGQDSATVTVIDVAPTATVTKTALPTSVDEPGGNVTFSVTVSNTGTAESLDLTALVDDIHGDLNGQGTCSVPQTIATSGSYACSFTAAVNGNAGDSETDTVTATVSDDDGNTIMPSDSATVTITGVASSIAVTKTPAPTTVDEPGGNVTFTIRIDNTSPVDSVTISSLTDDVHGDLNGQGSCTVPQAIAVGGFYECSFTASVTGNAGDSETDTVTASGTDDDGDPVSGQDSATVTVIDVAPTATVTKTALPTSVDEPGGNVTFSVTVSNTGTAESLSLTALVDDIHGDLNGQGTCSVPQTIASSGSYACSFTVAVNGNAGDSETDTVTATVSDRTTATRSCRLIRRRSPSLEPIGAMRRIPPIRPCWRTTGRDTRFRPASFLVPESTLRPTANRTPRRVATTPTATMTKDGVVFAAVLLPGTMVGVDVTASQPGLLDAWIDFSGNGSWAEAGEKVFDGEALAAGINSLAVNVPPTAATGTTVARFRLSSAGVADPTGLAADGEVEDLQVAIQSPSISLTKTANPSLSGPNREVRLRSPCGSTTPGPPSAFTGQPHRTTSTAI